MYQAIMRALERSTGKPSRAKWTELTLRDWAMFALVFVAGVAFWCLPALLLG